VSHPYQEPHDEAIERCEEKLYEFTWDKKHIVKNPAVFALRCHACNNFNISPPSSRRKNSERHQESYSGSLDFYACHDGKGEIAHMVCASCYKDENPSYEHFGWGSDRDDTSSEPSAPEVSIQNSPKALAGLKVGDHIEVNYKSEGTWYPAKYQGMENFKDGLFVRVTYADKGPNSIFHTKKETVRLLPDTAVTSPEVAAPAVAAPEVADAAVAEPEETTGWITFVTDAANWIGGKLVG